MAPLVLIVEDSEDAREMYSDYLRVSGMRVEEAGDGIEAIEKCRALMPDIVLMDVSLPGLDGWEVTSMIKSDPVTARIPIIALTGHVFPEEIETARDVGCHGFLAKPCLPDQVVFEIRRILREAQ